MKYSIFYVFRSKMMGGEYKKGFARCPLIIPAVVKDIFCVQYWPSVLPRLSNFFKLEFNKNRLFVEIVLI